jgi:hypothetical protein
MTQTQHHSPRHGITPSWRCCPWTSTQYISTLGNKHSVQKTIASSQSQNTRKLTEGNYIQFSKTPRILLTKAMTSTRNNFHDCQRIELGSWNDCWDRKATVPQSIASHPKIWELHWKDLHTLLPQRNFTMQQLKKQMRRWKRTWEHARRPFIWARQSVYTVECSTLRDDWKWFRVSLVRRDILPSELARWRQERTEWNGDGAKTTHACPRKTLSVVQLLSISQRADCCFHSDWYFLSPSGLCFVLCFSTRKSNTFWWRVVWSCLFCFFLLYRCYKCYLLRISSVLFLRMLRLGSSFLRRTPWRAAFSAVFSSICLKQCTNIERAGLVTLRCRITT